MSIEKLGRRELLRRVALSGAGLGLFGAAREPETTLAQAALADKVPTKELGTTGQQIPILLMGGSQKFSTPFDKMLHRAFKQGLFYIDTAAEYANGQSHKTLGPFVEQVGRENLWITSKSGMFGHTGTPEEHLAAIEKAMPDLGTDHLDMFLFHGLKDPKVLDPEYIKMGQDMKKRGFARFFGFACHDGNVVELMNKAARIGSAGIDAVMFRYNFTMYGDLELNKAIDACRKAGIGLIAMKVQTAVPQDAEQVLKFQSQSFTLHQARLKAVWADERIDACVSGINNMKVLRENVAAAKSSIELSMNEYMQLRRYAAETAPYRCQGCSHLCEPKVQGDVRVADTLRFLMYDECYLDHEEARRLYQELRPEERELDDIDFTEATLACPQGIDIRSRLHDARARLA